jgi:hypothetical protein
MSSNIFTEKSSVQEKTSSRAGASVKGEPKKSKSNMIKQSLKGKSYPEQKTMLKPQNSPLTVSDKETTAKEGFRGTSQAVPYKSEMEGKFGMSFDDVKTYSGGQAKSAAKGLGAEAFTYGNQIAFKHDKPSKDTVAHELTHVIQQSNVHSGVQNKTAIPSSDAEQEKQADDVAKGRSSLPSSIHREGTHTGIQPMTKKVQFTGHSLSAPLPEGAETPAHSGEREATRQRQYSVEQYIEMWEKERGRKMTDEEKQTLARGCIGITAVELNAGNPPLDNAYATFEKAHEVMKEWNAFVEGNKDKDMGNGLKLGDYKAVMFAKLFWSNQNPATDLSKPDDKAFRPDPKTGKVDMKKYRYIAQPGYVNFDYGFWDEDTQSFWHANHCQPGMKVYQSTRDKFAAGYIDFDRIIYCVAWARNYKPREAARNS